MGDMSGRFKMQTRTDCGGQNREQAHSSGSVTQFKGQFKGAMEHYTWVRFAGKLTYCQTYAHSKGQHHEHVRNSRSDQGSVQGGTGGNVAEGLKGEHSAQKLILR